MRVITYIQAIREALQEEMERDDRVFVLGEDVRVGVMGATRGLYERFGGGRVINTPISEAGFCGVGIGAALVGKRPVVEIMYSNFMYLAFEQIINQAAKMRYMFGGQAQVPIVFRTVTGARGSGAGHHSDTVYPHLLSTPGLIQIYPSNPREAKGLLKSAIRNDNPVIFYEGATLLGARGPVPEGEYVIPIGKAEVKREGAEVTVVGVGTTVNLALSVAEKLAGEVSVEVIDPRTLVPLDMDTIMASVNKTGRLVVVEDVPPVGGLGSEIIARLMEKGQQNLPPRFKQVTRPNAHVPFSPPLEKHMLPNEGRLVAAIRGVMGRTDRP